MQYQRIPDEGSRDRLSQEQTDNVVLTLMLCREPWPWSVAEIARELGQSDAGDIVRRLTESGLVHRLGEFVFPTRTARRAAELESGGLRWPRRGGLKWPQLASVGVCG
jgi:hypothetical protein